MKWFTKMNMNTKLDNRLFKQRTEMLDFDKLIEVSGLRIKLNEPLDLILRIHITFSIAPAKMKISFFIFTHTKYIYLKRRINLLHNHGTHKNFKKERYWRKKLSNTFMAVKVKESKGTKAY